MILVVSVLRSLLFKNVQQHSAHTFCLNFGGRVLVLFTQTNWNSIIVISRSLEQEQL